ncbi:MAG: YbfB/YjiJ family MFS transporter [Sedimentitalea sp.]
MSYAARQWLILLGLCLGMCVTNGFARFAYGLILPAMRDQLGWSYAQAGWLNTANALGYIVGALLTMALIGRMNPSRLFGIGMVATTGTLLATGVHEALWWQSLWRFLTGVTGALSFSTAGVLAAQLFPGDVRRNALSIAVLFGFGGGLGIILAGASLPLMLDVFGPASWPWAWVIVGGASLVFLPLSLWAAERLRPPVFEPPPKVRLPLRAMAAEIAGYAAFGMGYIVYLTFLVAWMSAQDKGPGLIALVWVMIGVCTSLSPFLWRPVFARFANGVPLAMILTGIAAGSVLPVFVPTGFGLIASAVVFGLSVFMAPGAVTTFTRANLPATAWGAAISFYTVVFAVAQTLGPIGAGLIGDATGSIGTALLVAAAVLLAGAALALCQRRIDGA